MRMQACSQVDRQGWTTPYRRWKLQLGCETRKTAAQNSENIHVWNVLRLFLLLRITLTYLHAYLLTYLLTYCWLFVSEALTSLYIVWHVMWNRVFLMPKLTFLIKIRHKVQVPLLFALLWTPIHQFPASEKVLNSDKNDHPSSSGYGLVIMSVSTKLKQLITESLSFDWSGSMPLGFGRKRTYIEHRHTYIAYIYTYIRFLSAFCHNKLRDLHVHTNI